jgi:hypothetical protein
MGNLLGLGELDECGGNEEWTWIIGKKETNTTMDYGANGRNH